MTTFSFFKSLLFFLLTISDSFMQINGLSFGINYGQIARNLPSHSRVAMLIRSMNVTRIKLYDADPNVLLAFSKSNVEFVIGIGWPSNGDADEIGATPQNAKLYNGNLLRRIEEKQGTPGKPLVPIDVYVFALFNEDLKPGPASERNYGLYYPDGSPVYNIGLQGYLPQMVVPSKSNNLSFNVLVCIITCLIFALELLES